MDATYENITALCIWREARGEGHFGMAAVGCVIFNRSKKHHMSMGAAVMVPWAFSSMTASHDVQLGNYPKDTDAQWQDAINIAEALNQQWATELAKDITFGATLYYDDSIQFPKSWKKEHTQFTVKIGKLNFFKEI